MSATAEIPPHVLDQPAPRFELDRVETPAFVVDLGLLKNNLEKLAMVQRESGAKVLLAQKGFSMWSTYPLLRQYLSGCCASGLHEALLAHDEFGKEVHVYAPFFTAEEMEQILPIACHISFNSLAQWRKWRPMIERARAAGHAPSPGIRVNPEHSEVEVALYDPCSPGCRLGIRAETLEGEDLEGLEGLHFHALCEQDSDVLERTLAAVESRFPKLLSQVKWVNMGGGHHITRKDYDVDRLIRVIRDFKQRWNKEVYLEPGEAIALNTGYLIASVMDIVGQTCVAKPQKSTIDQTQSHESNRTHLLSGRSRSDREIAARALHARLKETARRIDRADAAERLNAEAESLRAWAEENSWVIPTAELESLMGDVADLEGASEHDVFLDAENGRVIKLKKSPNFGARGEAKSYIENMLACATLLGLDWQFEGLVEAYDGLRIVSSQPFVEGDRTEVEQIDSHFAMVGFTKVRENTYRNDQGITVADARGDNILRDRDGILHFIDVHVLGFESVMESPVTGDSVLPTTILNISATAHMPDTLEMPYRPHIIGAGFPNEFAHTYRLGGPTCLAGDVVNDYSFPQPLEIGQKLVFTDMAHYTMVKTTTFNGVPHPDIDTFDPETGELRIVRRFGYEDFKRKLS